MVFFIVDDSGETAYFVSIDVQGDGPVRKLRLRDDVGEDVVVLVRYGVILSRGVTAHRRTLDRMELGKEYAPDGTLLAASFVVVVSVVVSIEALFTALTKIDHCWCRMSAQLCCPHHCSKNYTFEVKLHGTVLTTVVAAEVWELVAVVGSVASAGKAEHSVQIHQFLSWRVPDDAMQSAELFDLGKSFLHEDVQ